MPFKSKKQMGKFFAMEDRGDLPEGTAERWAHHTKNIKKLPEKVHKKAASFDYQLGFDVGQALVKQAVGIEQAPAAIQPIKPLVLPGPGVMPGTVLARKRMEGMTPGAPRMQRGNIIAGPPTSFGGIPQ